jgi:DNA-binding MarR family transcriptional regulator
MDYGTGEVLYPSEMDTIMQVGRKPGISVTDLAEALGETKGAASQMVMKLVKKLLLRKSKDPENGKRLRLHLTKKGEQAFQYHERFHGIFDARIRSEFEKLTPKQIHSIERWFQKLEQTADDYLEALR